MLSRGLPFLHHLLWQIHFMHTLDDMPSYPTQVGNATMKGAAAREPTVRICKGV